MLSPELRVELHLVTQRGRLGGFQAGLSPFLHCTGAMPAAFWLVEMTVKVHSQLVRRDVETVEPGRQWQRRIDPVGY
jgi:hypothetical protein